MGWVANQQCKRWKTSRICGAAFLCCICLILFTPRIPHSPNHHHFVDMRNLLGIPNTLNVMTNFPFLVVGILGFVLALEGGVFNISSQGEVCAWALFYAGIVGVAFGSAYYHLKPDDHRVLWDTLPALKHLNPQNILLASCCQLGHGLLSLSLIKKLTIWSMADDGDLLLAFV
ncbi:hypothetical protein SESBI_12374 [Sesbania bispinosa]|nr:hypothetical protein SESBI_12374 [Sesbania bispinosa]